MKKIVFFCVVYFIALFSKAQLQAGFCKTEFIDMLKVSAHHGDSAYINSIPKQHKYSLHYRSPILGLDNLWDLWVSEDKIAVISIRGTTVSSISWLANFYAAMAPAKGEIQLTDSVRFVYDLADDPKAAVHVGWLVATGFISEGVINKIDSCYQQGFRDFIIMGHSQGGAIAYLLRSYINGVQKAGKLPKDVRIKTYCSASPKPGNLYYAYAYEELTSDGWGFNLVNSADWVPETPISVQTLDDFNTTNPFGSLKPTIKKQKFSQRIFLNYAYNQMNKPTRKALKNYQKYLGKMVSKYIRNNIKGFEPPDYYPSINYTRAGSNIVLVGKEDYYALYPNDRERNFTHHFHTPYLYLVNQLKD